MLEVTFVRTRGRRDHVYVRRSDGTTADWAFPSYGDGLPHDLCHLVVEDELGLTDGFWGLIDQGVEVGLVNNEATLLRDGKPYADQPGVDLTGLLQAEAAVATLASPAIAVAIAESGLALASQPGAADPRRDQGAGATELAMVLERFPQGLPSTVTPEAVEAIGTRLRDLGPRWRAIADKGRIELPFPSPR